MHIEPQDVVWIVTTLIGYFINKKVRRESEIDCYRFEGAGVGDENQRDANVALRKALWLERGQLFMLSCGVIRVFLEPMTAGLLSKMTFSSAAVVGASAVMSGVGLLNMYLRRQQIEDVQRRRIGLTRTRSTEVENHDQS